LAAFCIAAAVQRITIEAERHRFTFRQTRRTVPITFSIMSVRASERRTFLRQCFVHHLGLAVAAGLAQVCPATDAGIRHSRSGADGLTKQSQSSSTAI
jgi:hypothetical protein